MTEAYVMEKLPEDMVVSEGARLMSLRNSRKITPERARKAAQARWTKHRERERLKMESEEQGDKPSEAE